MRRVGIEMADNKCKVMHTERNHLNYLYALLGSELTVTSLEKRPRQLTENLCYFMLAIVSDSRGEIF